MVGFSVAFVAKPTCQNEELCQAFAKQGFVVLLMSGLMSNSVLV